MKSTIFYSWQSDLPNSTNRNFINKALENVAKSILKDDSISIIPAIDRDTLDLPGSPDITTAIFNKIDKCDVFVADVSIINNRGQGRKTPNPNVLIELGYAIKTLNWDQIIMLMNTTFSTPQDLPFDLKTKRTLPYNMPENDSKNRLKERKNLEFKLQKAISIILNTISKDKAILTDNPSIPLTSDNSWRDTQRIPAMKGYSDSGYLAYMELFAVTSLPRVNKDQRTLLDAAEGAIIHTFKWPIGIMDRNNNDLRPKPTNDGLVNSILDEGKPFDYWALNKNANFYLLQTLFEDNQVKNALFYDTRIVRTTEIILYLYRLYQNLNVPENSLINITIRYAGLNGRILTATNRNSIFRSKGPASENDIESHIQVPMAALKKNIIENVKSLTYSLFILFDFCEIDESLYIEEINRFIEGRLD